MELKNQVRICIPICEHNARDLLGAMARAAEFADLIELRLDCLEEQQLEAAKSGISAALSSPRCPIIITFRPAEQGGRRALSLEDRILFRLREFWSHAGQRQLADHVDIESDLVVLLCQRAKEGWDQTIRHTFDWDQIICSHHDFVRVPPDLEKIYERIASTPAHILKIAVQADDVTDCIPIFHLLDRARKEGREMISIAMGTAGIATRVLGPSRGAFLTYGALEEESATAPGQITARELRQLYRIGKIDRQTQIMGLMGRPVSHSISPHIHNAAFEAAAVNAVYIPFEVRDVTGFIRRMIHSRTREIDWNVRGLSVTAPHKSVVMDHLDWIEPAAREIGAVNTIVVEGDMLQGYNTDGIGLVKPLIHRIGQLQDARCAVIGAGGAASAAVRALRHEGAEVTVFARDIAKARALSKKFYAAGDKLEGAHFDGFDVVINATPLGTFGPHETETPATPDQLRGARLAYDLVYNPIETRFLREACETGCETLGGLLMLLAQAAEQFRLWAGTDAPAEVMREAAERAMAFPTSRLSTDMTG